MVRETMSRRTLTIIPITTLVIVLFVIGYYVWRSVERAATAFETVPDSCGEDSLAFWTIELQLALTYVQKLWTRITFTYFGSRPTLRYRSCVMRAFFVTWSQTLLWESSQEINEVYISAVVVQTGVEQSILCDGNFPKRSTFSLLTGISMVS